MSTYFCNFTGKICHDTPKKAREMLRSASERKGRRKNRKQRHVYHCRKCGFWHFGMPDHKRKRFTF